MKPVFETTLAAEVSCIGVGVHSGDRVRLTLAPAATGVGIVFERTDITGHNKIAARTENGIETPFCTRIRNSAGVELTTIEHVLAALAACGVDNAIVRVNGPEVPIMDGSSKPFMDMIRRAGLREQSAPRRYIRILRPVVIEEGGRRAALLPADTFSIQFTVDFRNRAGLAAQTMDFTVDQKGFSDLIASARTFSFLEDVEKMKAAGFIKGGSLSNALVLGQDGQAVNPEGMRYEDECVRHKILDALGDLMMAGAPIIGRYEAYNSGHEFNHRLLVELFAQPDAWTFETAIGVSAHHMQNLTNHRRAAR
ncbi:MAG: UDP-3-O-acyl-N-acetylglucosamine deacetylase [Holosporales bacterium]